MLGLALIVVFVSLLIWEDARFFEVSLWKLVVFAIVQIGYWLFSRGNNWLIAFDLLMNASSLGLILIVMLAYVKLRFGYQTKLTTYFGSGDSIFMAILAFGMSFSYYLLLIFVSSVFGILFVLFSRIKGKRPSVKVPFVSVVGVFYLFFLILAELRILPSLFSNWIN